MWQLTSPSPWPATTMTTPTQWPLSPMRSAPAGMDEGLAIREEAASSHRAVGWHGEVSSINCHTRVGVGTGILNMHFSLCRKYIDLMFWLCRSTNLAVGSSKPLLCINVYVQHVHDMHVYYVCVNKLYAIVITLNTLLLSHVHFFIEVSAQYTKC